LGALRKLSAPQLSAGPLGNRHEDKYLFDNMYYNQSSRNECCMKIKELPNHLSIKTKVNLVLIVLWAIPLFIFVPANSTKFIEQYQNNDKRLKAYNKFKEVCPEAEYTLDNFRNYLDDSATVDKVYTLLSEHYEMPPLVDFRKQIKEPSPHPVAQYFIVYQGEPCNMYYCFTYLPNILLYGEFAELLIRNYDLSHSKTTIIYILNPHWKYWFLVVGIISIITLYLRRDLLIKLHKKTNPL